MEKKSFTLKDLEEAAECNNLLFGQFLLENMGYENSYCSGFSKTEDDRFKVKWSDENDNTHSGFFHPDYLLRLINPEPALNSNQKTPIVEALEKLKAENTELRRQNKILLKLAAIEGDCETCMHNSFCSVPNPFQEDCAECEHQDSCPCVMCGVESHWQWDERDHSDEN